MPAPIRHPGGDGVVRLKFKTYVLSVVLVLVAVGLEVAVKPLFHGRAPLTLFAIAVALSAVYGGLGPGILATILSVCCAEFIFAGSIVSLLTGQPSVWLFGLIGIGMSVIIDNFRKRNESLEKAKTLLEAANKELAKRTEDLIQSNDELKRFAYALSHDLQSPLRSVGLLTEMLAEKLAGKLDEEDQESMRFILDGSHRAEEMIRRLLEYSVADHKTRVDVTTDLNTVMAAALDDVRPALDESGGKVTSESLPVVQADGDRIRQVFLNLFSNAIKYRSERPLAIHVSSLKTKDEWIISVRDNGIGIDKRYTEKIFGLFERLHSTAEYEGTGIGLAICRTIIQKHRGRLWVESELGKGSTFCFSLPQTKGAG